MSSSILPRGMYHLAAPEGKEFFVSDHLHLCRRLSISLSPSFCFFVSVVFIFVSVCLYLCLRLSLPLSPSVSTFVSVCLYLCPRLSLYLSPSVSFRFSLTSLIWSTTCLFSELTSTISLTSIPSCVRSRVIFDADEKIPRLFRISALSKYDCIYKVSNYNRKSSNHSKRHTGLEMSPTGNDAPSGAEVIYGKYAR